MDKMNKNIYENRRSDKWARKQERLKDREAIIGKMEQMKKNRKDIRKETKKLT